MALLLKTVGCIIIFTASALLGYVLSRDCARRPQELRELQLMLQMLENEISYLSNIITESFDRIHRSIKSTTGRIFFDTSGYLKEGKGIGACEAWEKAIKNNIGFTSLNSEDEEILISFGKMLGSSDLEGQLKNIKLALGQLKLQEKKAEELKIKNERMFKSLGILGGLAIVVITV